LLERAHGRTIADAMRSTLTTALSWIVASVVVLAVIALIFAWAGLWPPRNLELRPI
jgi:hypothetical protein